VDVYEKELREQLSVLRSSESKTADSLRDRPREIWIGLDGKESKGEAEELSAKMGDFEMRMLCNETAATVRSVFILQFDRCRIIVCRTTAFLFVRIEFFLTNLTNGFFPNSVIAF
jgi:hypothetical protein